MTGDREGRVRIRRAAIAAPVGHAAESRACLFICFPDFAPLKIWFEPSPF